GDFMLDGVTFPAAEVPVEFVAPVDPSEAVLPTGNLVDTLIVPDIGEFQVSMINSGIPTLFFNASELGYIGTELQDAINNDEEALARFETIRLHGAVKMGLSPDIETAQGSQHTPKIAFVAPAKAFTTSSGTDIAQDAIDLHVRALSMGKLHHAMMGTAAVAIGTAAAIPGTLVNLAAGGGAIESVTFGHPSGTLKVGASALLVDAKWQVEKVVMSRSARVLMEGNVRVPEPVV
ncbi:putative methylaconitate Delta-isomerase PrpF, partial [Glaciecola sp.]|nr:putative methylaconitate Delta-isomerase PrpF [Glaciecola sp.]